MADAQVQLFHLFQPDSGRKIRLEVPTVFGRNNSFYHYREEVRFTEQEAVELARLDYVEIEGDIKISRTHGVLDPKNLTIRDLNSKNGTYINRTLAPRTPGTAGQPYTLKAGDVINVGNMNFVVQLGEAGTESLCDRLGRDRHALLCPTGAAEIGVLGEFLSQRKRFQVREATSEEAIWAACSELQPKLDPLGILLVGLVGEPQGRSLKVGSETLGMESLLLRLAQLPGSKVVALQALGDPAGLEAIFRETAYQDTILITSTVPTLAGLDGLEPDIGTMPVSGLAGSLRGGAGGSGAYHAVVDGLDALLRPESNVMDVDWVEGYQGALSVVVGKRLHESYEVELSYRTDLHEGSFRVRHQFQSRPVDDNGSGVVGSWQAPGGPS